MKISNIQKYINEAIKGQQLYKQKIPADILYAKNLVIDCFNEYGFFENKTPPLQDNEFYIDVNSGSVSYSINVTVKDVAADKITPIVKALSMIGSTKVVRSKFDNRIKAVTVSIQKSEDEKQKPIAFNVPKIAGVIDRSTERQRKNGTVALFDTETEITYTLQSSGYVRKQREHSQLAQNLMMPGGGTPQEMVDLVIATINKDRKKMFSEHADAASNRITNFDLKRALIEIKRSRSK